MKNNMRFLINGVSLTSLMLLLSACQSPMAWWNENVEDGRTEQVVAGPRKPPLLNVQNKSPAAAPKINNAAPRPEPTIDSDPYAYYEMMEKKSAAVPAAAQAGQPSIAAPASAQGNWFDRMASSLQGEPAPAPTLTPPSEPVASATPVKSLAAPLPGSFGDQVLRASGKKITPGNKGERKPVPGNPKPLSAAEVPSKVEKALPAPAPVVAIDNQAEAAKTSTQAPQAPVMDAPSNSSEASVQHAPANTPKNWFERQLEAISGETPASKEALPPETPYPALSSVPANPEAFSDIRMEAHEKLQDMKTEHALAKASQTALQAEPSGLDAAQPMLEAPAPASAPNSAELPLLDAPAKPVVLTDEPATGVQLLGHATDAKPEATAVSDSAAEPAREKAQAVDAWVAAPLPAVPAGTGLANPEIAAPAEAPVEAPIAKSSKETPLADAQEPPPPPPAEPVIEATAAKNAAPAPSQEVVLETEPAPPPLAEEPASSLPSLNSTAAPVEAVSPAPAAAGLPSPDILRSVKVLPPSRYQNRQAQ